MANGWTAERRARQSTMIRSWKPWEKSTGPQTDGGKQRSRLNTLAHGAYSVEEKLAAKQLRDLVKDYKAALLNLKK